MRSFPTSPICFAVAATLICLAGGIQPANVAVAQSSSAGGSAQLLSYLRSRVDANPNDASSWRMLGRLYDQAGDAPAALSAFATAARLDPRSAAAQFDFASLLRRLNRPEDAAEHFARVVELAPDSQYAQQARQQLAGLPPPQRDEVRPASYEIKQFDGADQLELLEQREPPLTEPLRALSFRIEGGALYNTNVALTPTSRNFFAGRAESAQGFINPDIEYRFINNTQWRSGATFVGYFSVNENAFRALDLQSYQPGLFFEQTIPLDNTVIVPRVQYTFTHDEFGWLTFGNRHALTVSATSLWDSGGTSVVYWTGDYTNFLNDGGNPATSSRDGWTNSAGISHTYFVGLKHLSAITAGTDATYADTDGTDFTFAGVSLFAEALLPLCDTWSLKLDGGWGYRDYFRSDLVPSRNENVWRAGAELRKTLNEHWSVAGVFNYNRFDSANEFFAAERFVAGITTIFEY